MGKLVIAPCACGETSKPKVRRIKGAGFVIECPGCGASTPACASKQAAAAAWAAADVMSDDGGSSEIL